MGRKKLTKKNCEYCDNRCEHEKMSLKVSLGTVDEGFRNNRVNQHLCSVDEEVITLSIN